ncbi:hypothetical protein K3495_g2317 [Podosphaera aphanis]|nr:hypothetical protein K3495_g2317 [Podosphaera aphanis]
MKSWDEGKKELQNEFTRICASIEQNIFKEIHNSATVQVDKEELKILRENSAHIEELVRNNAHLAEELEKSRAIVAQVGSLQRENEHLKNELDHKIHSLTHGNIPKSKQADETISKTMNSDLLPHNSQADHHRLIKKNEILSKNCEKLKEAWIKMERKLREQKKNNKEWACHVQQKDAAIKMKSQKVKELEQIVKVLKGKLGDEKVSPEGPMEFTFEPSTPVSNTEKKRLEMLSSHRHQCTSPHRSLSKSSLALDSLDGHQTLKSSSFNHLEDCQSDAKEKKDNSTVENNNQRCTSSLERAPDSSIQKIKTTSLSAIEEPSTRSPSLPEKSQSISTHSRKDLKRKRCHYNNENPHQKRVDVIARSPIRIHGLQYQTDSIDLDLIGAQFDTPRKQRQFLDHSAECGAPPSLITAGPRNPRQKQSSISHKKFIDNEQKQSLPNHHNISNYNPNPLNCSHHCKNREVNEVSENHQKNLITKTSSPDFAMHSENSPNRAGRQVISPSTASGKHFSELTSPSMRKICRDVQRLDSPSSKEMDPNSGEHLQPISHQMMRYTPTSIHSSPHQKSDSKGSLKQTKLNLRESPAPRARQLSDEKSSTTRKNCKSRKGPLRDYPIEELNIRDFKINPQYNQGYQYAYSEVVRGHARSGLRGCLKPCCEPKYRALAQISRNPNKKPTLSQQEAENLMLEEYMGDNAYKLMNMSNIDREELLVLAKTRDLANKHGNHRHMYENPETPVGLWRADFPTTQEAIEEEKKNEERTLKIVKRRYAEAMRPGGAYKFRDE